MSLLLLVACGAPDDTGGTPDDARSAAGVAPVVVYSSRPEQMMKPAFDAYTAETGVPVRHVTDGEQSLLQKLLAEGESTPADLLLAVDAGNLWYAVEEDLLRPVYGDVLQQNIPARLRDPENMWFAMSVYARTIVYDTRTVDPADLSDYAGLADDRWRASLCLSTSTNVHNRSLVAALIAQFGEREAEIIVRGWVRNLATDVFPDDAQLVEAIAAGRCQIGLANSDYVGRWQRNSPDFALSLFWPSAATGGVHVNVAGAGVTRHAKNAGGAKALLEWMSGDAAQALLSGESLEFPANPRVAPPPPAATWGEFSASPMNVSVAGAYHVDAVKLMDRARYR